MAHSCSVCERPTNKRCLGCKKVYYCSRRCQTDTWTYHIFECDPSKKINTAYHLAIAAYEDDFPNDPQTCEDYGFTKVFTAYDRSHLLGLYIGLFRALLVTPKELHAWRKEGRLVEEIKAQYETLPPYNRGGYYPWFLQHQYVLDGSPSHASRQTSQLLAQAPEQSAPPPSVQDAVDDQIMDGERGEKSMPGHCDV